MAFEFAPISALLVLCSLVTAYLGIVIRRRPATPGGTAFASLLWTIGAWIFANVCEKSVGPLDQKLFFSYMQYVLSTILAATWYLFACQYTGQSKMAPRGLLALLVAAPVLVAVVCWTNGWHEWISYDARLRPVDLGPWWPSTTSERTYGPAFWGIASYCYLLLAAGGLIVLEYILRSAPWFRTQGLLLLDAMLAPLTLNILFVFGVRPLDNLDLTPFGFAITSLIGAWAILREGAFDLWPIARDIVLTEMPDAVFVLDRFGRLIDANAAAERLMGCDAGMAAGRQLDEACPLAQATVGKTDSVPMEWSIDGRRRHFLAKTSPLMRGDMELGRFVVISDVSERVRIEEERKEFFAAVQNSQKLESLGVLAGGVAHDFNNLLVAILGNASLARDKARKGSPIHTLLERIETSAEHAADLTHQLLLYSGRRSHAMRPVRLDELIHGVVDLLQWTVSKKVELTIEMESNLPWVLGDPSQLRQVVLNLISNASDAACGEPGRVRASLYSEEVESLSGTYFNSDLSPGRHVVLEVSDDGCGMDEETIRHVFEPFYSTKSEGRGLGLAAVLGIVRGHNGAVFLDSRPGVGTTFRIHLAPTAAPLRTDVEMQREDALVHGRGTILIADDEAAVREVADQSLRGAGFEVLFAVDGEEARTVFEASAEIIDGVVLDLSMPKLGGDEIIGRMRQRRPGIPILIISGYAEESVRARFPSQQPDAFLGKPFHAADLVAKVREIVERRMTSTANDCVPPEASVK